MVKETPVFAGLNLVVRDMDASVAFYRRLGLEIPDASIWQTDTGSHHVDVGMANGLDFDLDSESLASAYNTGWSRGDGGGNVIGFSFSSREAVDETYAELTGAGYNGLQPPYDAFFGARYAVVEDPDGNQVGLKSPQDDALRKAPPDV